MLHLFVFHLLSSGEQIYFVISAGISRSSDVLQSCFRSPFSPMRSVGFLQFLINASSSSSDVAIGIPLSILMFFHVFDFCCAKYMIIKQPCSCSINAIKRN